jgi:hypothetical protein
MIRDHVKQMIGRPVVIALGIAIFSVSAMLIVDHGPWSRPKVQHIDGTNYTTTGEAARAVGSRAGWDGTRHASPQCCC